MRPFVFALAAACVAAAAASPRTVMPAMMRGRPTGGMLRKPNHVHTGDGPILKL